MKRYRAAVIGCGRIGSELAADPLAPGVYTHAGAYVACERTNLVALVDRDSERLRRSGLRWGVAQHADVQRMLDEARPEIVSIATPIDSHLEILRIVLDATEVRAVLVEKPLGTDMAEARRLVSAAEERGIVLAVNYSRRFSPAYRHLRERIEAMELGTLQIVRGYYSTGLLHSGTHWIDLARFLVGEIEAVAARDELAEGGHDASLDLDLRFAGRVRGEVAALNGRYFGALEVDLVGTQGRFRVVDEGSRIEFFRVGPNRRFTGYRELARSEPDRDDALKDLLLLAVQDVVRSLDEAAPPLCSGQDGLAAMEVVRAARASVSAGGAFIPVAL